MCNFFYCFKSFFFLLLLMMWSIATACYTEIIHVFICIGHSWCTKLFRCLYIFIFGVLAGEMMHIEISQCLSHQF